jgi:CubicO group peptidase (beta-lactamase class C family)
MTINLTCKSILAVALFSIFSGNVIADTEINNKAPKATPADKKVSFWDMPYLEKSFIDTSPNDRKDNISVGVLGIDGGNKSSIVKMAKEIAENNQGKFDSVLISHKNKLIFESYYARGRIDLPHFQASVTKSHSSLAIGRAIQLGYLTMADLNKPVADFIKGIDLETLVDGAEKVTLHQAMTMRSGIRVSYENRKSIMDSSMNKQGVNTAQQFLQHSDAISSTSQTFKYQDADPRMTMQVLESVVPGSAKDFIKHEVLAKLGITDYSWKLDANGMPTPESGASLTSRDMLKLGTLVLNKGKWQGKQLISADYLSKATSGITKPSEDWISDNFLYGYFWYETEIKINDKNYFAKFAWGAGEQYILTFEAIDLTIVFTAHAGENNTMQLVTESILPAFLTAE